MNAKGVIGVMVGFALVVGACSDSDEPEPAEALSQPSAQSASVAPVAPVVAPTPAAAPEPPKLAVKRVIDGDTFELTDGMKVRPLGIDSCEMNTKGGKTAKETAEYWLIGKPITLRAEPSVDKDQWGRLLRYVDVDGEDFGELMVLYAHTIVYRGKNDASPAYVANLRTKDDGRLDCSGAISPTPVNDTAYEPGGGGDDDSKSRFCGRKWYC